MVAAEEQEQNDENRRFLDDVDEDEDDAYDPATDMIEEDENEEDENDQHNDDGYDSFDDEEELKPKDTLDASKDSEEIQKVSSLWSTKEAFVEWENSYSNSSLKFQQSYGFSMDIAGQRPRSLLNVINQKGIKVNQVIQYTTWGGVMLILIACVFQWYLVSDIPQQQPLSSN